MPSWGSVGEMLGGEAPRTTACWAGRAEAAGERGRQAGGGQTAALAGEWNLRQTELFQGNSGDVCHGYNPSLPPLLFFPRNSL